MNANQAVEEDEWPVMTLDEISLQLDLIAAIRANTTQRVIERAEQRAVQAGRRQAQAIDQSLKYGPGIASVLAIALTQLDRLALDRPSIRVIAPDTGGRTFHLKYDTITNGKREKSTKAAGGRSGVNSPTPPLPSVALPLNDGSKTFTKEAAHQKYVERDGAVAGVSAKEGLLSQDFKEAEGLIWADGGEVRRAGTYPEVTQMGSAIGAQAYIENARKLFGHSASFGTIGETLQQRVEFWELVNLHESKGGRTQSRLVLELPHEATADQRHEIVRQFTDAKFKAKGIPFWAAIHSPTKDNDARNFHAHIVYVERPMARMPHPQTGQIVWDFTVAEVYRNETRHKRTHYPHRQKRDPEMREEGWLAQTRRDFSDIVNAVMCAEGEPALYDPRSYKDMGLDVEPMPSISRITADKAKSGKSLVLDAKRAAAQADREVQQAGMRRVVALKQSHEIDQHVRRAACNGHYAERVRAKIPGHLRIEAGPGRAGGSVFGKGFVEKVLSIERERQQYFFESEVIQSVLDTIIHMTAPRLPGEMGGGDDVLDLDTLGDIELAARDEMNDHLLAGQSVKRRFQTTLGILKTAWDRGIPYLLAMPSQWKNAPVPFSMALITSLKTDQNRGREGWLPVIDPETRPDDVLKVVTEQINAMVAQTKNLGAYHAGLTSEARLRSELQVAEPSASENPGSVPRAAKSEVSIGISSKPAPVLDNTQDDDPIIRQKAQRRKAILARRSKATKGQER